jgi:hypothetical protein
LHSRIWGEFEELNMATEQRKYCKSGIEKKTGIEVPYLSNPIRTKNIEKEMRGRW